MTNKQNIKCLFGFHKYTITHHHTILKCVWCQRVGYQQFPGDNIEDWYEYNEQGNTIHRKYTGTEEVN